MKLTFDRTIDRYVISELGEILHTTPDFYAAQRLAGMEPEPEAIDPAEIKVDGDSWDLSDLFEGL